MPNFMMSSNKFEIISLCLDAIKQIPSCRVALDKFKLKLHVKETAMMSESQSATLHCKSVSKYKNPGVLQFRV